MSITRATITSKRIIGNPSINHQFNVEFNKIVRRQKNKQLKKGNNCNKFLYGRYILYR